MNFGTKSPLPLHCLPPSRTNMQVLANGGYKTRFLQQCNITCELPMPTRRRVALNKPIFRRLEEYMRQRSRLPIEIHVGRFWDSVSPNGSRPPPLPGLLNAMYLLVCMWSDDINFKSLQPIFLARARKYQAETLGKPGTNLVQWIQASCMLGWYLSAVGRALEARQEVRHESRVRIGRQHSHILTPADLDHCSRRSTLWAS